MRQENRRARAYVTPVSREPPLSLIITDPDLFFEIDTRDAREALMASQHDNSRRSPRQNARLMQVQPITPSFILCTVLTTLILAGCGGGSAIHRLSRKAIRERAIVSARLTRGAFAVAGIGRRITRSANAARPRLKMVLRAALRARDTPPDFDADTGLYFVIASQLDGSGEEALFGDASHNVPAGAFVWQAPVWANNQKDSYPAAIHTDYQINVGDFAGERGTIDFVANEASGDNGKMHVELTTQQNERIVSDFDIENGVVRAKAKCSAADGTTWDEVDTPQPDGGMICTIDFSDGSMETLTMSADGSSTETLTAPDGSVEASGSLSPDGIDDLIFDDGGTETVDVDTADAGDDTGSDDSSDDGSRVGGRAATRKPGSRK